MHRKEPLVTGEIYHVYTRSIASFRIFDHENEYFRMQEALSYYRPSWIPICLARFLELKKSGTLNTSRQTHPQKTTPPDLATIIAYCLMPTHLHLVLRQELDDGISIYMAKALNSYSRFFNTLHKRNGPLWQGRFEYRRVTTDEQLLHLTRYVHLNPATARLVEKAEEWPASSYREYINPEGIPALCTVRPFISLNSVEYRKFTEDRRDEQRALAVLKRLLLDE